MSGWHQYDQATLTVLLGIYTEALPKAQSTEAAMALNQIREEIEATIQTMKSNT